MHAKEWAWWQNCNPNNIQNVLHYVQSNENDFIFILMIEKIFFLCLSARASHHRCKASHFIYYGMPSIKWKARINGMVSSEKWRRSRENKRHEECTWMSMAWSTLNNFSFYLNFIHSIRSLRFFQLSFKHNANEHEVAHSIQFAHFNSNAFTAAFFLSSDKWWKQNFSFCR